MAASTQKLALKVMRELAKEKEIHPSLLDCRLFREVARKACRTESDINRVFAYITTNRLVDLVPRGDEYAALPNENGLEWINCHRWKTEYTIKLLSIVIGIPSSIVALLALLKYMR